MSVKVFLSQPMANRNKEEIMREREKMAQFAKNLYGLTDISVINSYFGEIPHENTALWSLGESIKLLGTADIVFFAPRYKDARGCLIEHHCAEKYNISWCDISDDFKAVAATSEDLCTVRRGI